MGILALFVAYMCLPACRASAQRTTQTHLERSFVSPYLVGWIKDVTHSTDTGLYCIAVSLVAAAAIVLTMPKKVVNR